MALAVAGNAMLRALLAASLLALVPAACTVGDVSAPGGDGSGAGDGDGSGGGDGDGDGSGGGGPDAAPPASTSLQVLPGSASMTLGTTSRFDVVVTSEHYVGPVSLALEGAPASWQVSFEPAELVFDGSGSLTATLEVTVPPNGDSGAVATEVIALADIGELRGAVSFQVDNVYVVPIADGVGQAGNHGFQQEVVLRLGTTVRFANYDTTSAHTIHADGVIDHQDDQMAAAPAAGAMGGTYEVVADQSGVASFYCHDHGQNTGTGIISVGQ